MEGNRLFRRDRKGVVPILNVLIALAWIADSIVIEVYPYVFGTRGRLDQDL